MAPSGRCYLSAPLLSETLVPCRLLLLSSAAAVTAALLLLASTFWLSEMASPKVMPGSWDAAGICGALPVDTCFECLKQVRSS